MDPLAKLKFLEKNCTVPKNTQIPFQLDYLSKYVWVDPSNQFNFLKIEFL